MGELIQSGFTFFDTNGPHHCAHNTHRLEIAKYCYTRAKGPRFEVVIPHAAPEAKFYTLKESLEYVAKVTKEIPWING